MKVAFDTNVLAYAEGLGDAQRHAAAVDLIAGLSPGAAVLPVQALGELYNVLTRKGGRSGIAARQAIFLWRDSFPLIGTSPAVMMAASDLAVDHRFFIWDAVILAAAAEDGCRLLLSEDLQEGFSWRGVTVTNPFLANRHPLLEGLLKTSTRPR